MTSFHEALKEPGAWTGRAPGLNVPAFAPQMVLGHAAGHVIHVYEDGETWFVQQPAASGSGPGPLVARFCKITTAGGLAAFQHDLDHRYGADAQAQLERAVRDISVFALHAGLRGHIHITSDYALIFFMQADGRTYSLSLPKALHEALKACQHILRPDRAGACLYTSNIFWIHLPTTTHGALEFLAREQADRGQPG